MYLKISLAFPLKVVEERVSNLMYPLMEHVVKVQLYPKSEYVSHWKEEMDTWLTRIQSDVTLVKTKSGKVKEETLLGWMLPFISEHRLVNFVRLAKRKYGESSNSISSQKLRENLQGIIHPLLNEGDIEEIIETLVS
jgi:hypothetical protein